MKKILVILSVALLVIGCSESEVPTVEFPDYDNEVINSLNVADLSDYEKVGTTSAWIKEIDLDTVMELYEDEADFVLYVGFPGCNYCQHLIEVLEETAREAEVPFAYWPITVEDYDNPAYQEFMTYNDKFLEVDSETDEKVLYMPYVTVIDEGEIIYSQIGTVSSHNAYERDLNENEVKLIKNRIFDALTTMFEE